MVFGMAEKVLNKTAELKKSAEKLLVRIRGGMGNVSMIADGMSKVVGEDADKVKVGAGTVRDAKAQVMDDCQSLIGIYAKIGNSCAETGNGDEAVKYYAEAVKMGWEISKMIVQSDFSIEDKRVRVAKIALVLLDVAKKTGDKKLQGEAEQVLENNTNATAKLSMTFDEKGRLLDAKGEVVKKKQEKPKKKLPYDPSYS